MLANVLSLGIALPDYVSDNGVLIIAIIVGAIALASIFGGPGRMMERLQSILPGRALANLHAGHHLHFDAQAGELDYGPATGTPPTQYPVVVVPFGGTPVYPPQQDPGITGQLLQAVLALAGRGHDTQGTTPAQPALPDATTHAPVTPAAVPTPTLGQIGPAGSPIQVGNGAADLQVCFRRTGPAGRATNWSGWYRVANLPGGALPGNVGPAGSGAPFEPGDVVVAKFARETDEGADSAPWTVT